MYTTATKGTNSARHYHTYRSEQRRIQRSLRHALNSNKHVPNNGYETSMYLV